MSEESLKAEIADKAAEFNDRIEKMRNVIDTQHQTIWKQIEEIAGLKKERDEMHQTIADQNESICVQKDVITACNDALRELRHKLAEQDKMKMTAHDGRTVMVDGFMAITQQEHESLTRDLQTERKTISIMRETIQNLEQTLADEVGAKNLYKNQLEQEKQANSGLMCEIVDLKAKLKAKLKARAVGQTLDDAKLAAVHRRMAQIEDGQRMLWLEVRGMKHGASELQRTMESYNKTTLHFINDLQESRNKMEKENGNG